MVKWADYLISGIWVSSEPNSHVSHVYLHENSAGGFGEGVKTSEADVVKLLLAHNTVKTMEWDYKNVMWIEGAEIGWIEVKGVKYLRSHKDKKIIDNLKNMIRMSDFFFDN